MSAIQDPYRKFKIRHSMDDIMKISSFWLINAAPEEFYIKNY